MPMIDVYAAAGTFPDTHTLARDLATAVMTVERVPDIPMFRDNTAAFVHELPAAAISNVNGDSTYVRVQVLTNAGALDRDKQLAVVAQLTSIVADAAGDPSLADRTWVLLTEAPEGGWGLHGHANTNAELVAAARAQIAELGGRRRRPDEPLGRRRPANLEIAVRSVPARIQRSAQDADACGLAVEQAEAAADHDSFLTNFSVGGTMRGMLDIAVISDPAAAELLLDPVRSPLPGPSRSRPPRRCRQRVGLPRQLVNYHLRTLERHGLVELVEERRKGNVMERICVRALPPTSSPLSRSPRSSPIPDDPPIGSRPSGCWRLPRGWCGTWARCWPVPRATAGRSRPSPWTARSASPAPPTEPRSRTSWPPQ